MCGIDEAGRGPVIGPMVVAGVWMEKDDERSLSAAGVRDSKKLTAARRERLAARIRDGCACELTAVEPADIDSLRAAMSLNDLEAHVFAELAGRLPADVYYVDAASSNADAFCAQIRGRLPAACVVVCEHGADDTYVAVAAASIVAKVERDARVANIAEELEKELDLPLGSGYPSDERTIRFIKTWFSTYGELPPHVRRSWKTIADILRDAGQRTLF
jgi:ribonuclease HII